MLRFLWKLGLLLPIPLGVAWINWHVDPAKALGQHDSDPARYKYENLIAASLIAGRPEPLVAPHNQLILNELMFRSFTRLDVLVSGIAWQSRSTRACAAAETSSTQPHSASGSRKWSLLTSGS